jgi:hypothetical protein
MRIRWSRIVLGGFIVVVVMALCISTVLLSSTFLGVDDSLTTISEWTDELGTTAAAQPGSGGPATGPSPVPGDLQPFDVLTLQYTPYMATLALVAARGYMAESGFELRLHDVYDPDIDLSEEAQCEAVRTGEYHALATTLDATRKCGEGVAVGIPIGQSAGNDAIVVKPGVQTWNQVFEHAIAFTGYSVSEYMACFASHTANQPIRLPLRYDGAEDAVDAWQNAGPEQDIQSVVAWEPEVNRALGSVDGARVLLSSRDVRILWDIVEFSVARAEAEPEAYRAFTRAYYMALRDLTRDPVGTLSSIVAWAGDDETRQALLTTMDPDEFSADLNNEAFATLQDAAVLMGGNLETLTNRLEEAAFYWEYCNVAVPTVSDVSALVLRDFVTEAAADRTLLTGPAERASQEVFQVTDFTNAEAVTDSQIQEARVLFQTGIEIEFLPNRTDFRDPGAATEALANAVRFLRTCQDCLLEVQGGAAYPGEAVCPACRAEDSDSLAVDRGRRVYDELRLRFGVPEAQLRFVDAPHPPAHPGSNNENELRLDRRTFLKGLQLAGR